MDLEQAIPSVKAAVALHSTIAGIADIEDSTSLEIAGITGKQLVPFKKDLHRLLTTGLEEPISYKAFAARLKIKTKSTVSQIARSAAGLVVPLPRCSTITPTPDVPTCRIWMVRSFFCRVLRAVEKWADPDAVPADGISPELSLGSLVPDFDDGARLGLVQMANREDVFQPFDVKAKDPGSKKVNAETTVHGFATVLWDNNPTGCSAIVSFPKEG